MIRKLFPALCFLTFPACGQAESDGFLSDHNVCNADLAALSDDAVQGEAPRTISAVDADGGSTFGQRMTNFTKSLDLHGLSVRVATEVALTGDLEVEIWAKIDKELAYGQTIATITPEGEQGVILAKGFVMPSMLPAGEFTWVNVPLEEITSVFASGRYWMMYKPAAGDSPTASVAAGAGLATYDVRTMAWTLSTVEHAGHQVIPCQ